jgi:hypothetical protein
MAINIQSLFSDIIETPAQRQERMLGEGILRGRELTGGLTGLARTQAPLVSALSMQMPQRQEALRRGVGGMLGLDVRTESEKVQEALQGVDPNDPQSLLQAAQAVGNLGLGAQSAQMRAMAADATRQKQADLMAQQDFAMSQARDIQNISESQQRELSAVQNRLLAQQRIGQELTSFEFEQRLNDINLEEAEIKLKQLKEGGSVDEIFGGQKILPNGTIYYASKSGDTIVKDINGNVLTGEEARVSLDEGHELETEQQRKIYQARRLGTESGMIAANSFEQIGTQRAMLSSLRDAARLVEEGAATTDLEAFLKPLNQATNFLKQITGQLTLDQLSQVTMGALSEKELELLQATAAPSGFDKPAIIQWYKDKAAVTEKALGVLEEQAVYFSQPGATPGEWIQIQKQVRESQIQAAPGPNDDDARNSVLAKVLGTETSSETKPVDTDEAALEAARQEILRGR